MNRRTFLASAVAAGAAIVVEKPRFISPVQVYRSGEWVAVPSGLVDIKQGEIFRVLHPEPEFEGELHSSCPGIAVAGEDGHLITNWDGKLCGGCHSDFYDTLEEAIAAA